MKEGTRTCKAGDEVKPEESLAEKIAPSNLENYPFGTGAGGSKPPRRRWIVESGGSQTRLARPLVIVQQRAAEYYPTPSPLSFRGYFASSFATRVKRLAASRRIKKKRFESPSGAAEVGIEI